MTKSEFSKLFALLRGSFPQQAVTQETIEAYYAILGHHEYDTARAAFLRILNTATFWPSPGEISKNIAEAQANQPDPSTVLAEIHKAVSSVGRYGVPDVSDAARYVISCIGWENLCDTGADESMGTNAHILKIAATYRQRAIEEMAVRGTGLLPTTPLPALEPHRQIQPRYQLVQQGDAEPMSDEKHQRISSVLAEVFDRLQRNKRKPGGRSEAV